MSPKTDQKSNRGKPDFDYTKTWYLLPNDPEDLFFVSLFKGRVIQDKSAFRKRKDNCLKSRIKIANATNICRELSEPFIYPVKVDIRTRVEIADQYSWYVAKVELLDPINFWEIFTTIEENFPGTINLDGQPYIPQGLVFPRIVKGDLTFNYTHLPSKIILPDAIEGELKIQFCTIPPTWVLPAKTGKLTLLASSFYDNIDFKNITVTNLYIEGCSFPSKFTFPNNLPGTLEICDVIITSEFRLPAEVGNLTLNDATLKEGFVMPEKINGSLSLSNVTMALNCSMPKSCKSFSALECKFPDDFKLPMIDLVEIDFIDCDLPENFEIPDIPIKRLAFVDMEIPVGLKLPKEFCGTLEFEDSKLPEGILLPEKINGQLKMLHSKIAGPIKLPTNTDYEIIINVEDETENLIAPAELKMKILFVESKQNDFDSKEDLPF